jgi:hypothetical protein
VDAIPEYGRDPNDGNFDCMFAGMGSSVSHCIRSIAICVLVVTASACASKQTTPLTPTPQNPAAKGEVETRRTENNNTELDVEVKFMAPPQNVARDATVYVVWAKPLTPDAPPQNVGALVVKKDRTGSLKTKTPHERFDLFVTPEPKGNVTQPSHEPVMKAKVTR